MMKNYKIIAGLILITDQISKYWALEYVKGNPPKEWVAGIFRLEYAENTGAFLSLGSALSETVRFWVFNVIVTFLLVALGIYVYRTKNLENADRIALTCILAGGIGNLIDRYFRSNHAVIDFLNVGFGNLRTGIFNIADMAILGGVLFMALRPKTGASNSLRRT